MKPRENFNLKEGNVEYGSIAKEMDTPAESLELQSSTPWSYLY